MNRTIQDLLQRINADVLMKIARKLGLQKNLRRKQELVNGIKEHLQRRLPEVVAQLSETERLFLAEAVNMSSCTHPVSFSAKYGAPCPFPTRYGDYDSLLNILLGEEYGEPRIPEALTDELRRILPEPRQASIQIVEEIPTLHNVPGRWGRKATTRPVRVHEGHRMALDELRRVLNLAQAGRIRVAHKTKRPTEASVREIDKVLVGPDFDLEDPENQDWKYYEQAGSVRAHAWGVLLQQCKWAKPRANKLSLTPSGKKILATMDIEMFRRGVDQMITNDSFDELNRINHIKGQSGIGKRYLSNPIYRKDLIIESIREWPVNQWISFDEVFRFVYADGCGYGVTGAAHYLYFCERRYGYLSGAEHEINKQYLRAFLFESSATLGLIDVAYTYPHGLWPELRGTWGTDDMAFCGRYDGLLYVRLNDFGAYCMNKTDTYEPTRHTESLEFKVLPTHEIIFLTDSPISPPDQCRLDFFSIETGDHSRKIDERRILGHLENGGTIDEILDFLETHSSVEIPDTIKALLSDMQKKASAITNVEDALLVTFDDDWSAFLIANDSNAKKYCLAAGDRHLVVPRKNVRGFENAIKKLGYVLPK